MTLTTIERPPAPPPDLPDQLLLDVEVTVSHLVQGRPCNTFRCPLALAIVAACGRAGLPLRLGAPVAVYGDSADVYPHQARHYHGSLPTIARMNIARFDHGHGAAIEPFSFRLLLVQQRAQFEDI